MSGARLLRCTLLVTAVLTALTAEDLKVPYLLTTPPDLSGRPLKMPESMHLPARCRSQQVRRYSEQPMCSSSRSKWSFNAATGHCEWFAHYGCQLHSGNVFNSRQDCEVACVSGVENPCSVAQCVPISSFYKSTCFLLNDTICIKEITRRYLHISDATVRRIVAQPDIESSCQAPVARCLNTGVNMQLPSWETPPVLESSPVPPHCRLPPDRGFCPSGSRGRLSRVYFYSRRHNECKFMVHFGCGGNLNRFASQAECHNVCSL